MARVKIGFTGTSRGMRMVQKAALRDVLIIMSGEFHHGDCVGADAEAHDIAVSLRFELVIHPPINPSKRAFKQAKTIRGPLDYLDRNKVIIDETEVLVAAPGETNERVRSGTWSTVRYARRRGREIIIIFPDGRVKMEKSTRVLELECLL